MDYGKLSGANRSHSPIVTAAKKNPSKKLGQNVRPVRLDSAKGTKNGRPSGTKISVSVASLLIATILCDLYHVMINVMMLMSGSVNNNAPSRGIRVAISETTAIKIAEMISFTTNHAIVFAAFVPW